MKGFSIHIDAATAQRLKQYRIRYLKENAGKPLPSVAMITRYAINQWLDGAQ
ncbi:hypothetical protein [Hafnia paralvei]|uniref:hypothetical protein n=1 Tax=Hafnia paralvei TaxID=546367 RepID=UPI001CCC8C4F|nr:hypothetical protein [Hafnia paralvei]UBM41186.1 hypothetical protein K9N75_01515 [Hafnia paralvei]